VYVLFERRKIDKKSKLTAIAIELSVADIDIAVAHSSEKLL